MEDTASPVVIFGGRSEIGLELATRLAAGAIVVLAARGADPVMAASAAACESEYDSAA